MKRLTPAAHPWILSGFLLALLPLACSTDRSGLGDLDAGGSTGGRPGTASGGRGGSGGNGGGSTGGRIGTASGGAASGGRDGTGGISTGGAATGGANTGGAATGGRGSGGANTGGASTGGAATGGANTGGRGTGGANTGGAATGGANTGGRGTGGAGTGGRGTGGAGTGGRAAQPQPECTTASDCKLVDDCCTCAAIVADQDQPACSLLFCSDNKCAALERPRNEAVSCVAGRCVAGFNCEASGVTCRTAPPDCPNGQVPGVNGGGTCYTGSCVPTTQCNSVDDCSRCSSTQACVTNETRGGHTHHCVTIPAGCDGKAACGCLGETTCLAPYSSCSTGPGSDSITCGCPTC